MSKKIFLVLLLLLLVAPAAQAQIKIVPNCAATGSCNTCDFLALGINLTEMIGLFAGTTAVVMLIIGGLMWILGGANENLIEKGKKLVVGTFTGLIITFFAWTLVNFLIYALSGDSLGGAKIFTSDWWDPQCSIPQEITVGEDCTGVNAKVGTRCKDAYNFCFNASLAVGGQCTDANPCQCLNWCDYTKNMSSAIDSTCVDEGGSCPSTYRASSGANTCGEGRECCLKYP